MIRESLYGLRVLRDYRQLMRTVRQRVPDADPDVLQKAFRFAHDAHEGQKRLSGEPYIIHPVAVAQTLAEQGLDTSTIVAGLLHDVVEDTAFGPDVIAREFGEEVHKLVSAVTKISIVKKSGTAAALRGAKEQEAAENIRMMLLATARDVRVILIKLADKLHNMRTLGHQRPDKVERIANETLRIYAPIAGRLGMYRTKSELEDLSFASLDPEGYQKIKQSLAATRSDTDKLLKSITKVLKQRLAEINIEAKIGSRAKHAYSISVKMNAQAKKLDEIYDLRGIRIIVPEIRDCYGALGIAHTLWAPIQGRFKDYIATPKINGYQSLHTTVVGPDGRALEIQIRTTAMDEMAEHGIAAHWLYKSVGGETGLHRSRWLHRLSVLTEANGDTSEFIEDLKQELSPEEVYVFTPKGDIIDLPMGSSVLDFAFRVHTEVGLRCRGALVNDRLVPLRTELHSGDRVEILTEKKPNPSPNWLRYIKSPRSKQKLRAYLRKLREDEAPSERHAEKAPERTADAVRGEDRLRALQELRIRRSKTQDPKRANIEVAGAKDIPVRYAGCCSPVPGDRIVGFITRGRGVTVHRADCSFLPTEPAEQERLIPVAWEGLTEKYPVALDIRAHDRQGLYLDLVAQITRTHTNILKAEADLPRTGKGLMRARFVLEVEHIDHLNELVESLLTVDGVVTVDRVADNKAVQPTTAERKR